MKTIKCLIIFSMLTYSALAQISDFSCPMPELQNKTNMSWTYPLFGPTGTLKILVVYCKFSDDNFDLSPHTDVWPSTHNSMPTWGPSMLSQNVQADYYDPSISGYFQDMSMNNFQIIGETRFYQPQHGQSYYWISSGRHIGYLVEEILTGINNNVDYSQFDQWDPYDFDNDNIRNEPDGKVDFIAICFRFANTTQLDWQKYNGIAGLTGNHGVFGNGSSQLTLDGKIISASLLNSGTFQENVIDPNTGLDVFAHEFGHYLFGAIHFTKIGFHGLMGAMGNGVMSSFERYKLGWIQPVTVLTDAPNNYLQDAITTGSVKKVNINASSYFLIDNHQRISYYESSYKQYNNGPLRSPGTGVLVSQCTSSSIDIESMFGRWNWKKSGNLYVYPFEVENTNRINGEDKLELIQKPTTAGTKNHPDYLGAPDDYMNPGYFQIFSPWSNPSTYPDASNICIELAAIDENKVARVNIYTQNAIQQAPSKPQNLKIVQSSNLHPLLTWEANLESDITSYKVYKYITYESGWQYLTTTTLPTYEDPTESYCPPGQQCMSGHNVSYKVTAMDNQLKESVPSDSKTTHVLGGDPSKIVVNPPTSNLPSKYNLSANYPNPFNPNTIINYAVKDAGLVSIKVYDILGAEVATLVNETKEAGEYAVEFNASALPSGVYIYTLQVNGFTSSKKMLLMK